MFILSSKVHLLLCLKHNIHYRDNIVYCDKMSFCYRNYRDIGFFIIAQPYYIPSDFKKYLCVYSCTHTYTQKNFFDCPGNYLTVYTCVL